MRPKEKKPRRIDEDHQLRAESVDERVNQAIVLENVERSVLSNITTDGSISISGRNNILRNISLIEPADINIRGQYNILQNVRRVRRRI